MELKNRRELVNLLKKLNFKIGVEIGVSEGYFSRHILENTDVTLYSVDPWEKNPNEPYESLRNPSAAYALAQKLLKPFGEKSIMVKGYSPDVCVDFNDDSMDFVYIDGLHNYDAVKADINGWYSKVKTGGIIAGHDYGMKEWGVADAVDEFVLKNKLTLFVTGISSSRDNLDEEFDGYQPSWWFYKTM